MQYSTSQYCSQHHAHDIVTDYLLIYGTVNQLKFMTVSIQIRMWLPIATGGDTSSTVTLLMDAVKGYHVGWKIMWFNQVCNQAWASNQQLNNPLFPWYSSCMQQQTSARTCTACVVVRSAEWFACLATTPLQTWWTILWMCMGWLQPGHSTSTVTDRHSRLTPHNT